MASRFVRREDRSMASIGAIKKRKPFGAWPAGEVRCQLAPLFRPARRFELFVEVRIACKSNPFDQDEIEAWLDGLDADVVSISTAVAV